MQRRELADQGLAFDLEADEEKEERHQPVVDPEMQLLGELLAGETEGQFGMPETEVARCPGRIGPDQGGHGAGDEQNPAGSFQLGEFLKGLGEALERSLAGQGWSFIHDSGHRMLRFLSLRRVGKKFGKRNRAANSSPFGP